jgi:hypothetical protein
MGLTPPIPPRGPTMSDVETDLKTLMTDTVTGHVFTIDFNRNREGCLCGWVRGGEGVAIPAFEDHIVDVLLPVAVQAVTDALTSSGYQHQFTPTRDAPESPAPESPERMRP